jgi:hypothetical protein
LNGTPTARNLHATALSYDGVGVLIVGPSGAGKSLLALELLDHAMTAGREAVLIADDQVLIEARNGVPIATAPPTTAGRIELRGRGIVSRPYRSPAPLHLVLELVPELDRSPPAEAFTTTLAGIEVSRAPLPDTGDADSLHRRLLALEAVAACRGSGQKTT